MSSLLRKRKAATDRGLSPESAEPHAKGSDLGPEALVFAPKVADLITHALGRFGKDLSDPRGERGLDAAQTHPGIGQGAEVVRVLAEDPEHHRLPGIGVATPGFEGDEVAHDHAAPILVFDLGNGSPDLRIQG